MAMAQAAQAQQAQENMMRLQQVRINITMNMILIVVFMMLMILRYYDNFADAQQSPCNVMWQQQVTMTSIIIIFFGQYETIT